MEAIRKLEDKKLAVTPAEAMSLTSIGKNTIYVALNSGELRGKRIGSRKWVIPLDELKRWLMDN